MLIKILTAKSFRLMGPPIGFVVCSLVLTGCLSALLGKGEVKSRNYSLPRLDATWQPIDPAEADRAYRNTLDNSILSISSMCGEDRFRSLEELSGDVLKQLPERKLMAAAKAITVDGHPGLISEVQGKVDGKELKVRLAVIRTTRCIYDIYLAGAALEDTSRLAFEQILAGFHEQEGL